MGLIDLEQHRARRIADEVRRQADREVEATLCHAFEAGVQVLEAQGLSVTDAAFSMRDSFRNTARIMNEIADAIDADAPPPTNPA